MECKHYHQHTVASADKWTKFGAAGEAVASFISDAYWLGGLVDLVAQLDKTGVGLSWYGLGVGSFFSFILTVGSVYSHTVVNANHQESSHEHRADECEHQHSVSKHRADEQGLLIADTPLTVMQKLALIADFVSHTGDIAGPITFVAQIAAREALPSWGTALVQCGATLFGGVSSVAGVRTCKKNMEARNAQMETENYKPLREVSLVMGLSQNNLNI
jgi:hypothetical protein